MANGDEEWNRWRGRTQALLENVDTSLKSIDGRLRSIEGSHWTMYGKIVGVSSVVAILINVIVLKGIA